MRKFVQKNSKKIYWLSLLATVLLSYGFLLTQVSVGIDDEAYGNYYGGDSLAAQGRVGYILVRFFADIYEFTPVWRELLGILIFVGVVSIFIRLFQEHSSGRFQTTASTILVLLTLSYPLLSERFLFSECVFSTPLQWLLCAGGIICLLAAHRETGSRRIPWLLGALAAIGGAMLFEKTVAAACATMAIQVALVTQLNEESPYYRQGKKLMQLAGMLAGTFVGGVLISAGGTAALRALVGQTNSGYVDRYVKYDFSSPLMSLAWCLKTVAERIVSGAVSGNEAFRTFLIVIVLFFAVGMVCAVRRRHFWLGLCVVCYTLMPFAPYLITANPDLPYRILDYWALWIGFAAAAVFVLLTQNMKRPRAREIAKYAALALCGLCMIRQSYAMTRVFYTDYRKYQQDVSTMQQIVYDLHSVVGAERDKPVLFIGCMPESEFVKTDEVAGSSIFRWGRQWSESDELQSNRIYDFFELHGYTLQRPEGIELSGEEYREFQNTARIRAAQLSDWPEEGYIREYPEYVLVRLGQPLYEIYEVSAEEFIDDFTNTKTPVEGDFWSDESENSMVCGGWCAFLGEDSWGARISLVLLDEQKDRQYVIAMSQVERPDISEYIGDGHDYSSSGYSQTFNVSGIEPSTYQVALLLQKGEKSTVILKDKIYRVD